jgi:LysM repeat protein
MRRLLIITLLALVVGALWFLRAPATARTVVVQSGDTLGKLANANDVTVEQLRTWNDLTGDLIHVGETLAVGPAPSVRFQLPSWGTEETPEVVEATPEQVAVRRVAKRRAQAPVVEDEGRTWPKLVRPAARTCLDATTMGDGDASMGRSVGLDPDEIGAVVRRFQTQTLRCADEHPDVGGTILLELGIGCDGRVLRAEVMEDGVGAPGYSACVANVMTYASFPAHARDEVVTRVPLIFQAAPSD